MRIPIIFAIDGNVVSQCGVTISSLLLNAKKETIYDIFILCEEQNLSQENKLLIQEAFKNQTNCSITFVDVGKVFSETRITGHVTQATYFRLLIPVLFPQFDKVIYADIDMIFQQDLSELFHDSLQNGELIAAALDFALDGEHYFRSDVPGKIGKSVKDYFNAGFLVMNLKLMRDEKVVEAFMKHAMIPYDQNDQDILNIVCNGRVQFLPTLFNFQLNHFKNYMWGQETVRISFANLFKRATLHYTWKHKPWNSLECVGYDTWWHYYKLSPFYDDQVYFKRQVEQIEACRNDYHNRTNKQLCLRILANIKQKFLKR